MSGERERERAREREKERKKEREKEQELTLANITICILTAHLKSTIMFDRIEVDPHHTLYFTEQGNPRALLFIHESRNASGIVLLWSWIIMGDQEVTFLDRK